MIWHLTVAASGRRRLGSTDAEVTRLVRAVARIGGARLLLFCVVDDHVHLVIAGERSAVSACARALGTVAWAMGCPVEPARVREVDGRDHLYGLVEYVLRQPVRHDLGVHPAAWPGSCLADLVGARHLPGFDPGAILRALPRMDPGRFWRTVELEPPRGGPSGELVRALGPREVLVGAAVALAADVGARTPEAVAARAIAVGLLGDADVPSRWIAADAGIPERTVRRLRHLEVAPEDVRAVERQLQLRGVLRNAPLVRPNASEERAIARSRVLAGDPWTGRRAARAG